MNTDYNTAMRDAEGTPVFVKDDGSYSEEYPKEHIVRRADNANKSVFAVFGFVGTDSDYEEYMELFENESDALDCATQIYGETGDPDKHMKEGEVFEVEVHEMPLN